MLITFTGEPTLAMSSLTFYINMQGEPNDAEAPGRRGCWLRQAQNLARPERSQRDLERQFPPNHPQTRQRWPYHPQARCDALESES